MKNIFCPSTILAVSVFVSGSIGIGLGLQEETQEPAAQQEAQPAQPREAGEETQAAVDEAFAAIDNMHHFMEYISQPNYRMLKEALKEEPQKRSDWKNVKVGALVLAETSAIVSQRVPDEADEERTALWKQISLDVYTSGKGLYESVGDYDKALENYGLMIDNCNRCHQEFADGAHQLEK